MKNYFKILLAAATVLSAPLAPAWTYNDGDVLLVFRKSAQDIEYNLGSVTNFLGKTNGYTATIANWDPTLVTANVGSFSGAKVALVATTAGTNWLSSAEPNTTAYNVSQSEFDTLRGTIGAVGTGPLYPIIIPVNSTNGYVIDSGGQYAASSYDYVVSGGHFSGISQLGGNAPFTVEQTLPATLDFWQILPTSVYPNSPPDKLIGTFTVSATGVIKFVAGPRAATVTSVTHSGNTSTVKFTTVVGSTYSLVYTNKLGGAVSTWIPDATTVTGNGSPLTINRTTTDSKEFYRVKAQ